VKDLKEANVEKRKLVKELATRESTTLTLKSETEAGEEVDGIKLIVRDFKESVDVDRMVQTATEIIKRNEAVVAIFYGSDGKNARIMVMAGKAALEKGVNASEIVKISTLIIGGGGGGRPNFAQGGGTQVAKLQEAIEKAQETLRKQLKDRTKDPHHGRC
jgi:alanyl-tRNA synthetase